MYDRSRTWADISLSALEHNYRTIEARLPEGCRMLSVVKANAYGHGACEVASRLAQLGASYLAVATPWEALELRNAGIRTPLLVLGHTPGQMVARLAKEDITISVSSAQQAREYSLALGGERIKAHIKVDTGMARLGVVCMGRLEEGAREVQQILLEHALDCEGIFTHFSTADEPADGGNTKDQYSLFCNLIDRVKKTSGKEFAIRHCANSGAIGQYAGTMMDMCRPGLALYGYASPGLSGLQPVMSFKTRIVEIKEVSPGTGVSYGRTFTSRRKTRLAVLPVGYADGLLRCLSGKFDLTVRELRAPQVGRICMDMCMADVTDIEGVCEGDEVTIFGAEAYENAETLARKAGMIPYELLCAVSARVPRFCV